MQYFNKNVLVGRSLSALQKGGGGGGGPFSDKAVPLGSTGIVVTCDQGREIRAAEEVIRLIEEVRWRVAAGWARVPTAWHLWHPWNCCVVWRMHAVSPTAGLDFAVCDPSLCVTSVG